MVASPLRLGDDILLVILREYRYMYSLLDLNLEAGAHGSICSLAPCVPPVGVIYGRPLSMLSVVFRDRKLEVFDRLSSTRLMEDVKTPRRRSDVAVRLQQLARARVAVQVFVKFRG